MSQALRGLLELVGKSVEEKGKHLPDLALAADERCIRIHFEHLLGQRTVRAGVCGCSHDDGEIKDLAERGVGHDVLLVESRVPVTSRLEETDLQVEDEEQLHKHQLGDWLVQ